MADSNSKQFLLDENLKLIEKRDKYENLLKEAEEELEQSNKDLGIIDCAAYGRSFITGGNEQVSRSQRRNVLKKIHKLPVDQTAVLGVKKSLIASGHRFLLRLLEFAPAGDSFVVLPVMGEKLTCGRAGPQRIL